MIVIRDGQELSLNTVILKTPRTDTKSKEDLFNNLGMKVQNLTDKLSISLGYQGEKGAIIINIQNGSPAFKAGLRKGDLIIEVQNKPVASSEDLYQAVLKIKNEEDILVFIKRPDKTSKFIVLKQKKDV